MRTLTGIVLASIMTLTSQTVAAQSYPNSPITIIVNSAAGGPVDIVARAIEGSMSRTLGQPIVIENRPTAGGVQAAGQFVRMQPDGYTLLLATGGSMLISPIINPAADYDPVGGVAHVMRLAEVPIVVTINADLPFEDMPGFIAAARENPNKYSYASNGLGTPSHLMGAVLSDLADIEIVHVPFAASTDAAVAVVAGEVSMYTSTPALIMPHIASGRLRGVLQTVPERMAQLPDIPAGPEVGLGDWVVPAWYGLFAPIGTPDEIVTRIAEAAATALADPEALRILEAGLFKPLAEGPDVFRAGHTAEFELWKVRLKDIGLTN